MEARVPRLEVDVQFLADDSMLVFHDAQFGAAAGGSGKVAEATRASSGRARHPGGETIAFLEDVVSVMARSETVLQVDLKLSRPITAQRARLLEAALEPLRDHVLVGSQAHWNLRRLRGVPIAFDPTLHWVYAANPPEIPRTLGAHGLWDDSPFATNPRFTDLEYLETRIDDLVALLPGAIEWMVDIETVFKIQELGLPLGEALRERGVALAAWTLRASDTERAATLARLFAAGVETVITDIPEAAAAAVL